MITANAAMFAVSGNICGAQVRDSKKPNVVFILVDDMGWRDLGCFGSEFYETPRIDSLAENGVRFTSAYSACHVSSPSRASILTGLYPASLGLTDWLPGRKDYPFQWFSTTNVRQGLPSGTETIAETLKDNGYRTALIGKWHLGENGSRPQEHGFDIHIPDGYLKGWPETYYAPFRMNEYNGQDGDYLTDRLTDEAIKFISENKNLPFFLLLSHFAVHDPIEGRPDLVRKYEKKLARMPSAHFDPYVLEGDPDDPDLLSSDELQEFMDNPVCSLHKILPHNLVKIKQVQDNVNFAAMVESVDESVGRIVSALDSLDLGKNTILIFYSDNGGMSAANYDNPNRIIDSKNADKAYSTSVVPLRGGKGWMYEGGIRVPLIVSWPGKIKPGTVSDFPVTGPDFYKTIVSLTNVTAPDWAGSDGIDFSPAIMGESMSERALFWHFPHYSNHGMSSPCGAVRFGKYKLIEYYRNGTVQLFDLDKDISETEDISKDFPEITDSLKKMLSNWRASVGAEMPVANASYDYGIAKERYTMAAPPVVFPCKARIKNMKYQYFPKKSYTENKETLMELLDSGMTAIAVYNKTADTSVLDEAIGIMKKAEDSIMSIRGDEDLTAEWNIFVSRLFAMTGNGYYISALVPSSENDDSSSSYRKILSECLAVEMYNNLLIVPICDYTIEPGIKFGGGSIDVCRTGNCINVYLADYVIPHAYPKYGIEILVGDRQVKSVSLNDKSVQWRYNDRGFVSIDSNWKEGDIVKVILE